MLYYRMLTVWYLTDVRIYFSHFFYSLRSYSIWWSHHLIIRIWCASLIHTIYFTTFKEINTNVGDYILKPSSSIISQFVMLLSLSEMFLFFLFYFFMESLWMKNLLKKVNLWWTSVDTATAILVMAWFWYMYLNFKLYSLLHILRRWFSYILLDLKHVVISIRKSIWNCSLNWVKF